MVPHEFPKIVGAMIVVIGNLHQVIAPLVQDRRTPTASTSPADTPVNKIIK